jgi:CelD/BcsL family acetyltransferase involved in cellulose biosynthesis
MATVHPQTYRQNSALDCEVVTTFSRLQELERHWRTWSQSDPGAHIFQHWEWACAFWRAYGGSVSLYSVAVHDGDALIGILPLVRRDSRLEFLGSPDSDYNDILCEECNSAAVLEAVLGCLLRSPADWRYCVFDKLPEQSRIARHAQSLPRSLRKHLQLVFRYPSPTILVDGGGANVLDPLIEKDQLRRYHRKLQKLGALRFRHLEDRGEAREHVGRFIEQHVARCAMAGRPSQFLQPDQRRFYEALVEELDLRTQLRFGVLELDSKPIAYHVGFRTNGKFIFYKPAFDVNYWDHCPGDVLLRSLLQYARECGVHEFDFSIGDESFKYRFANAVKRNYSLYLERHPARLGSRCRAVVRHAREEVRRRPALKRALNGIARRFDSALDRRAWDASVAAGRAIVRTAGRLREEVLFFRSTSRPLVAGASIEAVWPAGLDALARLSLQFPRSLTAATLHDYRRRLKQGDRAFAVRALDDRVAIFWVGTRSEIAVPGVAPGCALPLRAPALVLYDTWHPPGTSAEQVSPAALRALVDRCEADVWACCLGRQAGWRRVLDASGFQLDCRATHRGWFRWFRRTRFFPGDPRLETAGRRVDSCRSVNSAG